MKYTFSYSHPEQHFVDVEVETNVSEIDAIELHLPTWRPGRYELGNFAKNLRSMQAFDQNGHSVSFVKTDKSSWRFATAGIQTLKVRYQYYCAQLDAGACWLDEQQLYINPVHCCLYHKESIDQPCELELLLHPGYDVAISLKPAGTPVSKEPLVSHIFTAKNFHELVDSPFIASASMQRHSFQHDEGLFHLVFQGPCKPDLTKIENDFKAFISEQKQAMGAYAGAKNGEYEFTFLFQITPYAHYHGVEHLYSTVIALGPSNELNDALYPELLGVSSHEFYHTWNVKATRPIEMVPYDYAKENFTRLGFVDEGVTTYYGDLFLIRSGVFTQGEFFKCLNQQLHKHYQNPGRKNLSVADSSWDTWLDGYVPGVPGRKVSIYTEGCLCALMLDILIRKQHKNKKSLDDVMRRLFEEFGQQEKGYGEVDYKRIAEETAGISLDEFFNRFVYGTADYTQSLSESLDYVGCQLVARSAFDTCESKLGFKYQDIAGGSVRVTAIAPDSPAFQAGLAVDDEIIFINDFRVDGNPSVWVEYQNSKEVQLTLSRKGQAKNIVLAMSTESFWSSYKIETRSKRTAEQEANYTAWTKQTI